MYLHHWSYKALSKNYIELLLCYGGTCAHYISRGAEAARNGRRSEIKAQDTFHCLSSLSWSRTTLSLQAGVSCGGGDERATFNFAARHWITRAARHFYNCPGGRSASLRCATIPLIESSRARPQILSLSLSLSSSSFCTTALCAREAGLDFLSLEQQHVLCVFNENVLSDSWRKMRMLTFNSAIAALI